MAGVQPGQRSHRAGLGARHTRFCRSFRLRPSGAMAGRGQFESGAQEPLLPAGTLFPTAQKPVFTDFRAHLCCSAQKKDGGILRMQGRPRRSVLYMPGSNERALEKAENIPADALIFDLEDAVAPDAKALARRRRSAPRSENGGYGSREIVIRVNALETPWGIDDLMAAVCGRARRHPRAEGRAPRRHHQCGQDPARRARA